MCAMPHKEHFLRIPIWLLKSTSPQKTNDSEVQTHFDIKAMVYSEDMLHLEWE